MFQKNPWEKKEYYDSTLKFFQSYLSETKFFSMIKEYSASAGKILDCGCGNALILENIWNKQGKFYGVDISKTGINLAKKRLKSKKNIFLYQEALEKLPFEDNYFDLVYTAYVFEHVANPEKGIEEMIRVTKTGGYLFFICPNYGSPLFFSPSTFDKGLYSLYLALRSFIKSYLYLLKRPKSLDWLKVNPKYLVEKKWESDWDVTYEPNIQTLVNFLPERGVSVLICDSGADKLLAEELEKKRQFWKNIVKATVQFLARKKISPYIYYGGTVFIVGKKL